MVDESLISYLGKTAFVRSLFSPEFCYDKTKKDEYKAVADRLKAIKILDPACGSGAFPMGLLNRMIDILGHISPEENTYDLKLSIIENCIYGSDIQSIAAQITKLRFFISLICNCEKDASKPNFGIPTLPNLETKFVAANSLIAKKRQTCHSLFENPEIEPTKQALTEIRHEHFAAKTANRKSTLRQKDKELREKLARLLAEDNDFAPADAKQLAEWNPYDQNAVADFFDPEWMFGVSDGFDIVIGNPPYIQLQNDGGKLAKLYADCNYKTFARTGDIYCLFYERGHQLLKSNGHLCYITSNKWMRAGYGEKTRDFFAKNTNPMLLIDFAGVKIFESATVDTNILLFAKAANEHKTWCAVTNKQNKDSVKNLRIFSKPKIIWKIIGSRLAFTMDKEGYIVNNACYLMTGEYLLHVLAFLNSSPLIWYSEITNMNKTGVGDAQVGAQNIILFPIPKQTQKDGEITSVVNSLLNEYSEENANRLQNLIYDVFGLTNEESDYLSKMNL